MALALPTTLAPRFLPQRLPKVCLAVNADTADEMLEIAETRARENPFLELRLDYIKQPLSAMTKIRQFLETHQYVTAVATCRRADNGGQLKGSLAAELEVLNKAHAAGCQIVDLEMESALKTKADVLARLRRSAGLIVSFHDFRATRNLEATLEKMLQVPADYYKIVSTATTLSDNVTMMKFLQTQGDKNALIGLCMGEQGIISRVLSVRAGSVFTFGAVSAETKTAPGQMSARDLRNIYRIEQVDAATRVFGVAGDPIEHSLSPVIMNTALRRENVNGVYVALHAKTLKDLLYCVREIPLHGLSVTMPYKQSIVEHLDNTDAHTAKIGACNTVVRGQDGSFMGSILTLPAWWVRLSSELRSRMRKCWYWGPRCGARRGVWPEGTRRRGLDIESNGRQGTEACPAGEGPHHQACGPAQNGVRCHRQRYSSGDGNTKDCPLKEEEIQAKVVFDMVYDPVETRLLQIARAKGISVIPGVEMFVHQAARQFEIWTGKPAPAGDMLRVVTIAFLERAKERTATIQA